MCIQECSSTHTTPSHTHSESLPWPPSSAIIPCTSFPNGSWHYIKHNKGFHLLLFINQCASAQKGHSNTHSTVWVKTQPVYTKEKGEKQLCSLASESFLVCFLKAFQDKLLSFFSSTPISTQVCPLIFSLVLPKILSKYASPKIEFNIICQFIWSRIIVKHIKLLQ